MLRGSRRYDGTVLIKTEKYLANQDDYEALERETGLDFDPVDLNDGYVAVNKHGADNLQETQDNIQSRFELKKGGSVIHLTTKDRDNI